MILLALYLILNKPSFVSIRSVSQKEKDERTNEDNESSGVDLDLSFSDLIPRVDFHNIDEDTPVEAGRTESVLSKKIMAPSFS